MNQTPRVHDRTLVAGATDFIHDYGRMLTFVSITEDHSLKWAIDEGPGEEAIEGISFELPQENTFGKLKLYNAGASAATVKLILSIGRIFDMRAGLAKSLASIDSRLAGVASLTQLAKTNVAATGSTGTTLFASNANRRLVSVTAAEDNSGYVYVGKANTVSQTDALKVLFPGGEWWEEFWTGAVYAVGSDGSQNVFGYEV